MLGHRARPFAALVKASSLLTLFLIFSATAATRPTPPQREFVRLDGSKITEREIDSTVDRLIKGAEVTGAAVALINDGTVVFEKGYGFRDVEKHLPLTANTVMSAASFSKAAFAYMILQLVQAGEIDLDRPVYEYLPKPLPEYQQYRDLAGDERYKRITARMLLSHTSGFPNWRSLEDDHKLKIHFAPGTRFAYSGEGIDLLQLVVESVTHRGLEELMRQYVFEPLRMSRSSMVWQPAFESDFANGYDEYGRSLGPQRRTKADAAGSMQTTVHDFARFVTAVMAGQGLQPKIRQAMLSPQIAIHSKHEFPTLENASTSENDSIKLSYGLGWGLFWSADGEAFFKEGHDAGWRNYAVAFPAKKIGIVIMTNSGNGEGIYKYLLEEVLHDRGTPIEWEGFTPYDKLPPRPSLKQHRKVALDPAVLDRYVGEYGDPQKFPGLTLKVRRDGDHLFVQENDEPKQELAAESTVDFYSTASDDAYTFKADAGGKATSLVLHPGGPDIVLRRLR